MRKFWRGNWIAATSSGVAIALLLVGVMLIPRGRAQTPIPQGLSSWRRDGLRAEVDALAAEVGLLRAEVEQLRADHEVLVLREQAVRAAAAFSMAYQAGRQRTLADAEFPVGYMLRDVAGNAHFLTQEQIDQFGTLATIAEGHYTVLTTP